MKYIEELGISKFPWKLHEATDGFCFYIESGCEDWICDSQHFPNSLDEENANARLMAAAPELYECLREAIGEMCHLTCESRESCHNDEDKCFVVKWRKALAKASGENEGSNTNDFGAGASGSRVNNNKSPEMGA